MLKAMAGLKTDLRPADRQFPLKDGAVVYRTLAAARTEVKGDVHFAFEVAFGEGQIVDGQKVMPTLIQFGELVEEIVSEFGRSIFNEI